ncbi:hypothetical protein PUR28_11995 [Streptomyces sp. BE308]|uniref:hypothetical protein n=1 Tax=unclassified Streptomyces TaxID=2593676 RepID=UPI0009395C8B|nr:MULTISPECIES: hypothetical protein [unclassified Streptomyces]MEE1791485.1 hypothetical protein [Streptomyces sp. BE308]OKI48394.1 hypothetical protein A6A29_05075 [Streptomyces sp. TSRI0281]
MTGEGLDACMPEPGSYAVDVRDGRVGRVMGRVGPYVQLRPPGGGPEWDCPPEAVEPAPPGAVLRARVTEINREGQLPR